MSPCESKERAKLPTVMALSLKEKSLLWRVGLFFFAYSLVLHPHS